MNNIFPYNCRRIFLKNYEVNMFIGINEKEKIEKQKILINVDLFVSLDKNIPINDDIEEVVNYSFIRKIIIEIISNGHINLQETLCDNIFNKIIEHPLIIAAKISTQKKDIYNDCESVGVEIFRFKN